VAPTNAKLGFLFERPELPLVGHGSVLRAALSASKEAACHEEARPGNALIFITFFERQKFSAHELPSLEMAWH
jgi:hypothetical protein